MLAISNGRKKPSRIRVPGLAGKLRTVRLEKGLSQEQAADLLGLNRRTIHAWESGEVQPSLEALNKASELYERETDWFLGGWSDVELPDLELARRINALPDQYRQAVERVVGVFEED